MHAQTPHPHQSLTMHRNGEDIFMSLVARKVRAQLLIWCLLARLLCTMRLCLQVVSTDLQAWK